MRTKVIRTATIAVLLVVSLILPVQAGPPAQGPINSEELQELIDQAGYKWVAGKTSVSKLSKEEQKRLCGVPPEVEEWEKRQAECAKVEAEGGYGYSPSLDWRNNGGNYTTPIRDQFYCGSCVAFATIGAIESRMEIDQGNPSLSPDLSEAHLFFCDGSCCSAGWSPALALSSALGGIVDEACFPYPNGLGGTIPCTLCSDWQSRLTRIGTWWGTSNTSAMKEALAARGPFEATMNVYEDFTYYTGGIYQHVWGNYFGGHAITIVGYNDAGGYWIAKNSWGTGWGEAGGGEIGGWFRIAYGQCYIDDYGYIPEMYHGGTLTYLPIMLKNYRICQGQQLQNWDFERGNTIWVQQSGSYDIICQEFWTRSWCWSAYFADYNNADDRLYQSVTIPSGVYSARLKLYLYIFTEEGTSYPYDYFHVELQDSAGNTLQSFLQADNTMEGGWWKGTMSWSNFSTHAGKTRRIFMQGENDAILPTAFFVDDVTLDVHCGSLPPTSGVRAKEVEWTWEKVEAPPSGCAGRALGDLSKQRKH